MTRHTLDSSKSINADVIEKHISLYETNEWLLRKKFTVSDEETMTKINRRKLSRFNRGFLLKTGKIYHSKDIINVVIIIITSSSSSSSSIEECSSPMPGS